MRGRWMKHVRRWNRMEDGFRKVIGRDQEKICQAAAVIETWSARFDVRRLAAFTKTKNEIFFILCGWMTKKDEYKLGKQLEADPELFVTL